MKLPNKLLVQMDGRSWEDLSIKDKQKEIEFCIFRCQASISDELEDYDPDMGKVLYYKKQIRALNKLNKLLVV